MGGTRGEEILLAGNGEIFSYDENTSNTPRVLIGMIGNFIV